MLAPEYFNAIGYDLMALYGKLEDSIIRDIVRRLVKGGTITDTAIWQIQKLQEVGILYDDILDEIAKATGASAKQINKMFENAAITSIEFDDKIYHLAGLSPPPLRQSPAMLQVLLAGLNKTNGLVSNLTLTTANTAQTAYISACDAAYMQVASGAFSPQTAIKNAVKAAINQGGYVLYPTGHRDHLDVAIRRATLTGLTQTTMQLQWQRMDDLEVDLVEVSAHAGARPNHAAWQGRVYSRSGRSKKYPDFVSSTGYGSGAGLGGWNCRHSFYPFFDGLSHRAYTDEQLQNYQAGTFEYDGKVFNQFDGNQQQRAYERAIRQTKRELVGLDEGIKQAEFDELRNELKSEFDLASVKLKKQESKFRDFLDASGQRNERDRQQVYGFNRSVSSKAVWANKKTLNNGK